MRVERLTILAGAMLAAFLTFGCASTGRNASWIGRSQAELVKSKGRPSKTYSDGAGHTVLIYARPVPLAPTGGTDNGSLAPTAALTSYEEFLIDENGIVTDRSIGVIPAQINPFN